MAQDRSEDVPATNDAQKKPSTKIIKRYSNRKLYDTERSKYVTLDEIAQMIKAGEEVTIIDNESKEDLTSVTLTQIIFEEEKRESRMPLGMLRNLIQTGGDALQEFFDKSVKAPVVEIKDTAEKRVEELRHGVEELREAATRSVSEWTDTALRVFGRGDAEKRAEEFRKAFLESFEALEKQLRTRIEEAELKQPEVDPNAPAAPAAEAAVPAAIDAEGNGTGAAPAVAVEAPQPQHPAVHVREDVELLRQKMAAVTALIDQLDRAAP